MPFDSQGNFTRVMNWQEDAANSIPILASRHDDEDDNFANGFNEVMCRDGRTQMSGQLKMGNNKIVNVATGTANNDAVNKGQLDSAVANAVAGKQNTITGGASSITASNLTANRALISNGSGKVAVSAVTSTELGYLSGTTSKIQTQIDSKQPTVTGAATTITGSNLTANRALISNGSGKVAVATTTSTELGYVHGVTSAIQTQINNLTAADTTLQNQINTKANSSDAVLITGNQNIAGNKTFTNDVRITKAKPLLVEVNNSATKGTIPSSSVASSPLVYRDSVDKNLLEINHNIEATSGNSLGRLNVYKATTASNVLCRLTSHYNGNGQYYINFDASSPESGDVNLSLTRSTSSTTDTTIPCMGWVNSRLNSVLSTSGSGLATFNKASNGYFKFANGLLLQWGRKTITSTGTTTITYPQPFASASSYTVVKNYQSSKSTEFNDREGSFWDMTATGATTYVYTSDAAEFSWLAIGY